jgi:hypothetical protein
MCEKRTQDDALMAADTAFYFRHSSDKPDSFEMRKPAWAALWAAKAMEVKAMEANVDYPASLAIEDISEAKELQQKESKR